MTVTVIVSFIGSLFSIAVAIAALIMFSTNRRKLREEKLEMARTEGRNQKETERAREDLERAFEQIRKLRDCVNEDSTTNSVTLAKISKDIEHLVSSVDDIKEKLDKHLERHLEKVNDDH